jgi:hypothetical protein
MWAKDFFHSTELASLSRIPTPSIAIQLKAMRDAALNISNKQIAILVAEFAKLLSWPRAAMTVQTCLSNVGKLFCHRICKDMRLGRSSRYV